MKLSQIRRELFKDIDKLIEDSEFYKNGGVLIVYHGNDEYDYSFKSKEYANDYFNQLISSTVGMFIERHDDVIINPDKSVTIFKPYLDIINQLIKIGYIVDGEELPEILPVLPNWDIKHQKYNATTTNSNLLLSDIGYRIFNKETDKEENVYLNGEILASWEIIEDNEGKEIYKPILSGLVKIK